MSQPDKRDFLMRVLSLVAMVFGVMTIKEGGAVLFVDGAARVAAGNYVPFVLWFNFVAGFAYALAGVGIWLQKRWGVRLAIVIATATLGVFVAFGVHVAVGGAYEQRTFIAMALRSVVWIAIAAVVGWNTRQPRAFRTDRQS